MDTLGPANLANFSSVLLLYGGCPLLEIEGPVETTEFVLYREVKCIVYFNRGSTV